MVVSCHISTRSWKTNTTFNCYAISPAPCLVFWIMASQCSPGWPHSLCRPDWSWTLRALPASVSRMLRLSACDTVSDSPLLLSLQSLESPGRGEHWLGNYSDQIGLPVVISLRNCLDCWLMWAVPFLGMWSWAVEEPTSQWGLFLQGFWFSSCMSTWPSIP